jgi:hypothetical protein
MTSFSLKLKLFAVAFFVVVTFLSLSLERGLGLRQPALEYLSLS